MVLQPIFSLFKPNYSLSSDFHDWNLHPNFSFWGEAAKNVTLQLTSSTLMSLGVFGIPYIDLAPPGLLKSFHCFSSTTWLAPRHWCSSVLSGNHAVTFYSQWWQMPLFAKQKPWKPNIHSLSPSNRVTTPMWNDEVKNSMTVITSKFYSLGKKLSF
jgi:hypothetical protein